MLLSLALLPAVALLVFIYHMDKKEKEPIRLLWKLFLWGIAVIFPVVILENIIDFFVKLVTIEGSAGYAILEGFLVAAFTEECGKYFFLNRKTWMSEYFDCMFDGIVYAVFVSMGFAALENVAYVMGDGLSVAIMRMFTSVPGHACFAVFMGYYYSKARLAINRGDVELCKKYKRLALLVPILIHGTYDALIMTDSEVAGDGVSIIGWLIWIVFVIVLFIRAFVLVFKASKNDEYIVRHEEGWNCRCGRVCNTNFCGYCGCARIVDSVNSGIGYNF